MEHVSERVRALRNRCQLRAAAAATSPHATTDRDDTAVGLAVNDLPTAKQVARGLPFDETRAVQRLKVGSVIRGHVVGETTRGYLLMLDRVLHPVGPHRAVLCQLHRREATLRAVLPFASLPQGIAVVDSVIFAVVCEVDPDGERVLLTLDRHAMARPQTCVRLGLCNDDRDGENGDDIQGDHDRRHDGHESDQKDILGAPRTYVDELALRAVCHTAEATEWLEKRWDVPQGSSLVVGWHCPSHAGDQCHKAMRKRQDMALAADKVAQGVRHQKAGRKAEALACYERALLVCPHSADALVARGALRTTENKCVASLCALSVSSCAVGVFAALLCVTHW